MEFKEGVKISEEDPTKIVHTIEISYSLEEYLQRNGQIFSYMESISVKSMTAKTIEEDARLENSASP
jgi:hypothetical protein